MQTLQSGASAATCSERQFFVDYIVNWAESQPAHHHLKAEVERLKQERQRERA